ncbi:MAG TPA: gamma-glutamylcyclotransferase family protein [Luteolibacter sp.]|nr:gamma-glutamylcyclotransferase family protein [Luteolibacter sp.]
MSPTHSIIFVYGTLRPGGSNHFRMDGARFVAAATVRGALYRIDWYPAIVLADDAGEVHGEIFAVSPTQLAALDDYEGPEYRRVRTQAAAADGTLHEVWIWEWCGETLGRTPIPGGDWLKCE